MAAINGLVVTGHIAPLLVINRDTDMHVWTVPHFKPGRGTRQEKLNLLSRTNGCLRSELHIDLPAFKYGGYKVV